MIYISGKITGTNDYMQRFEQVERDLSDSYGDDELIINPARVNAQLPKECSYSDYLTISLALLSLCDRIYMMSGWEDSRGARLEHDYAVAHGYDVLYEDSI